MRFEQQRLEMSASDLARHLACQHLTFLDSLAARGHIDRLHRHDPALAVLQERGFRHEAAYLSHLESRGHIVLQDEGGLDEESRLERTVHAMRSGVEVIAQADLKNGKWGGRADVLLKVDRPSRLGNWSYEVTDTKLARETRGGTILQLCLYSELLAGLQGIVPDWMHVVTPGRGFQPETFRVHDYLAYYRFVKTRLENAVSDSEIPGTYPEPVEQCEICQWWPRCNDRRRMDDHLAFVAGISKLQIGELRGWEITSLASLATMPLPLTRRPQRGSPDGYAKVREQARLQFRYRTTKKPLHELLSLESERGLARLPAPSAGDVFLDFEADPFVEEGGIEYLLGCVTLSSVGETAYTSTWALDRLSERRMFESFIDLMMERRAAFPDFHIYHFSHYETSALKRLMGRYATREDEMDRMLRSGVFVDLHGIVKQAVRASVETYSLKDLEVFFGFERKTDLRDARQALHNLESALELNETASVPDGVRNTVEAYNREDCISTLRLRNWLEDIRRDLIVGGKEIKRPAVEPGDPTEAIDERRKRTLALMERLLHDIPDEPSDRSPEQQAKWLLAHLLEWHRREEKAPWWEFFRLRALTDEELIEERCAISGLQFLKRVGGTERSPVDRYRFPPQDAQIRDGDQLETSTGSFGSVQAIDNAERTIDVKKRQAMIETHPTSVFVHTVVRGTELAESLFRLGTWVADHGVDPTGPYRAGRDLLLRIRPRLNSGTPAALYNSDAEIVGEAKRLALQLDHSVLPIQGPPGSGKTFTGARMICALIRRQKKVGITAVSHKVIRRLLEEVLKAATEEDLTVACIEKVTDKSEVQNPAIPETKDNGRVLAALQDGEAQLAAGTGWLWARPEFVESIDVLFVDEAGQMSLADVLAVSQSADSIVLLGDPQQLEQPIQGAHPPGVDVSALQHVLGIGKTITADSGLFLDKTWRLSPPICRFTSELYYDNRLKPRDGLDRQRLAGPTVFAGSGLWFVPANHAGNQSSSDEEADIVCNIVRDLLQAGVTWLDGNGSRHPVGLNEVLIVSPYNAQVFNLAARLPNARIGTVDKFQGQEAPVVIYSMATSSLEDAPRGMEFLYSANRFNVATSRARCVCILVASPSIFQPECQTPHQMRLANALCRYLEMAQIRNWSTL